MAHPQIAAFARLAKENTPPVRSIQGQKTLISRTIHGMSYDAIHDEIVTPSPFAQAILIFKGSANGDVAPKRVLSGPDTQIRPVRDLTGESPGQAHVDSKHNLLVVNSGGKILIYDRMASGNAKPKAVISGVGASSGYNSFQISPKGWIIAGCDGGSICGWSLDENGQTTKRSKIPFLEITGYQHSGIAIDPTHKEVIFSAAAQRLPNPRPTSGIMNAVVTFSWPEVF